MPGLDSTVGYLNKYFEVLKSVFIYLSQFFARGQFGDVKKAMWNDKVVAVKVFSAADRKCGFSPEVS